MFVFSIDGVFILLCQLYNSITPEMSGLSRELNQIKGTVLLITRNLVCLIDCLVLIAFVVIL